MATPISRRQFFRLRPASAGRLMAENRTSQQGALPALIRPPGAVVPDDAFQAACERCNACAEACPFDVIHIMGPEAGSNEGTPIIEPVENECHWCPEFECIAACPSSALARQPGQSPPPMALARIDLSLCLNAQGTLCDDCVTVCPPSIRAIKMQHRRPVLDSERCVGCGACANVCPAQPKAITILPLRETGE